MQGYHQYVEHYINFIYFIFSKQDQFVYVPVSITDDSASNEPMQKFTLAFKDKPSDVELTTTGTSEIVINDNDSEWPLYCNYSFIL